MGNSNGGYPRNRDSFWPVTGPSAHRYRYLVLGRLKRPSRVVQKSQVGRGIAQLISSTENARGRHHLINCPGITIDRPRS